MGIRHTYFSSLLLFLIFHPHHNHHSRAQQAPNTTGFTCTANQNQNQSTYPCQTYAFYRAAAPDFLDLASIADLFSVSRRMISIPSNISSPAAPLHPNQPLFVPLTCSCNSINNSLSLSYANLTYTINKGDTFYYVSTSHFQNLTTFQSAEIVNSNVSPDLLQIGQTVIFPVFCRCPSTTQLQKQAYFLVSYVFQPSDNLSSIASRFGSTTESIVDVNGDSVRPFDTIFIPVSRPPQLKQPTVGAASSGKNDQKGVIIGLAIGLGICGTFLVLAIGLWGYRENLLKKRKIMDRDEECRQMGREKKVVLSMEVEKVKVNLMADVSDCLDKYRVYRIEELRGATDGFDQRWVIQGSVYKGCIDGGVYAIKKMNWNASEELKILQKVNHGNLVKLEGFCIDPEEEAKCYVVYEFVENGSLHSWLHERKGAGLSWKTRLRIAVDVANGLQYIHEHTRPQVVHKDIKTCNILLDATMRAKIANFGLAKSGCNAATASIVGTQGYSAPEYLAGGEVSAKTDVFAFGVVLLELVSGREAADGGWGELLWRSVEGVLDGEEEGKEERVRGWMDGFLLEDDDCSVESVLNVMAVAVACLHRDPSRRPSMAGIVYALCKCGDLVFDALRV
ncbi:serine/threonine receptor-like kinase NFP [Diospyros lotus]|uniref:serine/threonine receptor-like kinase NFP n=1 Tax=Diospyros lotus TaxID=55363 RepID=UPI00225B6572|nr:serine/threonine receptor-like kinase NFP [Diospyros lotus]